MGDKDEGPTSIGERILSLSRLSTFFSSHVLRGCCGILFLFCERERNAFFKLMGLRVNLVMIMGKMRGDFCNKKETTTTATKCTAIKPLYITNFK